MRAPYNLILAVLGFGLLLVLSGREVWHPVAKSELQPIFTGSFIAPAVLERCRKQMKTKFKENWFKWVNSDEILARAFNKSTTIVPKNFVVVEVGANAGQNLDHFLQFFTASPADVRLYMWEGNPLLHAAIDARIKGIPGITFIRGAATAEPGNITYRVNHNNAEGSSIGVVEPHPLLTYTTVPGIPLDSVVALSQEPVIDLLEIDVELGEFNVLAGATETLPRVQLIEFECKGSYMELLGDHAQAMSQIHITQFLARFGFIVYATGFKKLLMRMDGLFWDSSYDKTGQRIMTCIALRRNHPRFDSIVADSLWNYTAECQDAIINYPAHPA